MRNLLKPASCTEGRLLLTTIAMVGCGGATFAIAAQLAPFAYRVVGDTTEITDYPTKAVGDVKIPAEVEGNPVTRIAYRAFRDYCEPTK